MKHGTTSGGCTSPPLLSFSRALIALQVLPPLPRTQHLHPRSYRPCARKQQPSLTPLSAWAPYVTQESLLAGERYTWHRITPSRAS